MFGNLRDDSCIPQGSSFSSSIEDVRCCSNVYTNRCIFQVLRMFYKKLYQFHLSYVRRMIRSERCPDSCLSETWIECSRSVGVVWNSSDVCTGILDRIGYTLRRARSRSMRIRASQASDGRVRDPDEARYDRRVSLRSPCLSPQKDSSIGPCTASR